MSYAFTYDQWLGITCSRYGEHVRDCGAKKQTPCRWGQFYFNELPPLIAGEIVNTDADPFAFDHVSQAVETRVQELWETA